MITTSRFDPDPSKPNSVCKSCRVDLATKEDADQHRATTLAADASGIRRSHTTRTTNPSRAERVRGHVETVIADATEEYHSIDWLHRVIEVDDAAFDEAAEQLLADVDRGDLLYGEVTAVIAKHHGFDDAWMAVIADRDDAPDPVHPDQLDLLEGLTA